MEVFLIVYLIVTTLLGLLCLYGCVDDNYIPIEFFELDTGEISLGYALCLLFVIPSLVIAFGFYYPLRFLGNKFGRFFEYLSTVKIKWRK